MIGGGNVPNVGASEVYGNLEEGVDDTIEGILHARWVLEKIIHQG